MCRALAVTLILAFAAYGLAGCGQGHEQGTPAVKTPEKSAPLDPNAKPYPLKTCPVSGEELGKMGEPFRLTYKGQEIKLCCKGCEKDFNKEPEKYLQKIAAAAGK